MIVPAVTASPARDAVDEIVAALAASALLTDAEPDGWGATVQRVAVAGDIKAQVRTPIITVGLIRETHELRTSGLREVTLEVGVVAIWDDSRYEIPAGGDAGEAVLGAIMQAIIAHTYTTLDYPPTMDGGIVPGEAFLGEEQGSGTSAVQVNLRGRYEIDAATGAKS